MTYLEDIKTALYPEATTVHCDNALMPVNLSVWHYITEARPRTPVHILQQMQAWNLTFMTEDPANFGLLINTLTFSLFTYTKQNLPFN